MPLKFDERTGNALYDGGVIKMYPLDLTKPPFIRVPQQSPELAAADILCAFATVASLPDKVSRTFDAIAQCTGVSIQAPLIVAGQRIARDIDRGVGSGQGNTYHSTQHFCEVTMSAFFLALLNGLDTESQCEVALGALIHDFHHDGQGNGPTPFRLERIAVNQSAPYLIAAGVPPDQQKVIAALVLATDVIHGLPFVHKCCAHHTGGSALQEVDPAAPELAQLTVDPVVARKALLLTEADMLPSVGLSLAYGLELQHRLSQEWHRHLSLEDKYRFVTKSFRGFIVGNFFQPNVDTLCQTLLERISQDAAL